MKKPETNHLPAELLRLTYSLQKVRHAHAKVTEELFKLEQQLHTLSQPFLPQKR